MRNQFKYKTQHCKVYHITDKIQWYNYNYDDNIFDNNIYIIIYTY